VIAALVVALALSGADPCADAAPVCRRAARDAILTWRTSAALCEARLEAAVERLAARSSTVTAALAVPSPAPVLPTDPPWLGYVAVGAVGALLGLVGGLLALRH